MEEYVSAEVSPMEFPWTLNLVLKARNWLLVKRDGSINRYMEKLFHTSTPAQTRAGVSATDVIIDKGTGVWVRTFTPVDVPAQQKLPLMFYFHGGGFTAFSADSTFSDHFARYLCKTFEAIVVSVDYRKTPDHPYPAAYDDSHAALRWAAEGALSNADTSRCLLVGESAGGNIVHHVACRAALDPALAGKLTVVGNVALFPFFGGEERTPAELRLVNAPLLNYIMCDTAWKDFLPSGASRDHPAANVAGPEAPDLGDVPLAPFLVTVGEYDCLKDWQVRYVAALQRMGKQVEVKFYKGGIHCFHVFPQLKLTPQLQADLHHFVRSRLS